MKRFHHDNFSFGLEPPEEFSDEFGSLQISDATLVGSLSDTVTSYTSDSCVDEVVLPPKFLCGVLQQHQVNNIQEMITRMFRNCVSDPITVNST